MIELQNVSSLVLAQSVIATVMMVAYLLLYVAFAYHHHTERDPKKKCAGLRLNH